MQRLTPLLSTSVAVLVFGCSVERQPAPPERSVPFACSSDSDCEAGECLAEFGICTRGLGNLTSLLFEVIPQASDPVYGGARFLTRRDLRLTDLAGSEERGIPPGWLELNVRPRVPVQGRVFATAEQAACSRAASTLPVSLTFTPRERLLGASSPSYELRTILDRDLQPPEYTFAGALPPGRYDVYMRPESSELAPACRAIPQIFRNLSIGELSSDGEDPKTEAFDLTQPAPQSLRMTIPWQDELEGWMLDVVHPVTGEVISNRIQLRGADVAEGAANLITTLYYSRVDPTRVEPSQRDFINEGDELVRFAPPPSADAGTVLFQRSGIELLEPGSATVSEIATFGEPVQYQAWVWKRVENDLAIPGTVSFAALDLDGVEKGVFTSFTREAAIDSEGRVALALLPGRYRVRVTPPNTGLPNLGLVAGYETTVRVWPNPGGNNPSQQGHVLAVPPAVTISGEVLSANESAPLFGLEVRASASSPDPDACFRPREGEPNAGCARVPVLRNALAQDPFMPRTRTALTQGNGSFRVEGLDCAQCVPGGGVRFDVSVRPPPETGLAWQVISSLDVYEPTSVDRPIRMPVPVGQPMRVTYADPLTPGEARGLSGALVRVFGMIDDNFQLVSELEGVSACKAIAIPDGRRCIQSLIQVAELRSGENGDLLLLLPPNVE